MRDKSREIGTHILNRLGEHNILRVDISNAYSSDRNEVDRLSDWRAMTGRWSKAGGTLSSVEFRAVSPTDAMLRRETGSFPLFPLLPSALLAVFGSREPLSPPPPPTWREKTIANVVALHIPHLFHTCARKHFLERSLWARRHCTADNIDWILRSAIFSFENRFILHKHLLYRVHVRSTVSILYRTVAKRKGDHFLSYFEKLRDHTYDKCTIRKKFSVKVLSFRERCENERHVFVIATSDFCWRDADDLSRIILMRGLRLK